MMKKAILALILASTSVSQASRYLTPEENRCLFDKPVVIGASISAEMGRNVDYWFGIYDVFVNLLTWNQGVQGRTGGAKFGLSPANLLINGYAEKGSNQPRVDYSQMFTNEEHQLGSSQVQELLYGTHRDVFDKASVILAIDPFYWDAISDNCGYGYNYGVEADIYNLIQEASAQGTRLIMGNIPRENPSKVIIDSDRIGIPGLWYNPEPSCVASINNTLKEYCTPANGCYLIDIDAVVQKLNAGETISGFNVEMAKRDWKLLDLRPDGIHLSPEGSAVIFDGAVKALESSPPACVR